MAQSQNKSQNKSQNNSESSVLGKIVKAFTAYKVGVGALRMLAPTVAMTGIGYCLYRKLTGGTPSGAQEK